ncbi:MAG: preprotein translocase subunit SecY [Erysipelotrichia bacterium]|nr:preprotein translocase subunit SecY [Erysipelotrichia bacterium]
MKKLVNIVKNKEIMGRIVFTVLILFIFRLGAQVTVPGVSIPDDSMLNQYLSGNNALSLMNLLGGGTLQSFSIFALGVSPYITSQIIVQLLSTDVLPALSDLKRQGQYGRKKIEMTSRYLTLMLGAVQAYGIIKTMEASEYISFATAEYEWLTYIYIVIVLLAGTMLVMWLGDQISTKGIGNGVSMIIFAGIVSSLPSQFVTAWNMWGSPYVFAQGESEAIAGIFKFLLYIFAYLLIVAFVTFIELSKRKIPVQHSGKGGGQTQSMARASFLPIKINSASVIPVIFASSILMAPSVIMAFIDSDQGANAEWLNIFNSSALYDHGGWYMPWGLIIYLFLIIAFAFFYANMQINPQQLAENFQKNGSYIPGVRQGNETERYVRKVLNRVTVIGAGFLALIAALPPILTMTGVFGSNQSLALGGTGLIIVVGVALELNSQIDGLLAGKSFDEVVARGQE